MNMKTSNPKENKRPLPISPFSTHRKSMKKSPLQFDSKSKTNTVIKDVVNKSKTKDRSRPNAETKSSNSQHSSSMTPRIHEDSKTSSLAPVEEHEETKFLLNKESKSKFFHQHSLTMFGNSKSPIKQLDEHEDDTTRNFLIKEKSSVNPFKKAAANQSADAGNTSQIKVVSRFRPLNQVELELNTKNTGTICSRFQSKDTVVITNNFNINQTFTLDRIFDNNTTQEDFYENVAKSTIEDVLNGYNGTVFAYGQSGSGKTFSMYGTDLYEDEMKGIIPRAVQHVFDFINDEGNKDIKFELKFSMLEIYKENLHDLLSPNSKHSELKIKEHPKKGIYVMNLTEEYISDEEEFLMMIENADEFRVVSETGLNKNSSRSHLVFQLEIIQKFPDDTERRGILNLVDLAGSEKVTKTHAVGETLEEAKKINLSLSTLGNVISALTSCKNDYIPYRDSKLTRILKDSLGGNYKTTLIVTCSPHIYNCEETISTLNFASRAKKIKNKVKMNIKRPVEQLEAMIDSLSKQLTLTNEELVRLRSLINATDSTLGGASNVFTFSNINNSSINVNANITPDNINFFGNTDNTFPDIRINSLKENKKGVDCSKIIDDNNNYVNIIKQKDEEIQSLNDKMDILQEENKTLQDKLSRISRETGYIYFYQILENLENFTKKNINETKNLKFAHDDTRLCQLDQENKILKESYKNLEDKYFAMIKDIERKFNRDDNIKTESEINYTGKRKTTRTYETEEDPVCSFDEFLSKYQMNFQEFFERNSDSICDSYRNIYDNSKMYVNSLLKDFLKKKDMFGSKYRTDNFQTHTYTEGGESCVDYNHNYNFSSSNYEAKLLKGRYRDMKSSYMKMSMLLVYYEKVIFDLMNRVLVDIKKLELESSARIDIEEKCENFNKSLIMYMEILDDLKEMKALKETEEIRNKAQRKVTIDISNVEEIKEQENEDTCRDISKVSGLSYVFKKSHDEEVTQLPAFPTIPEKVPFINIEYTKNIKDAENSIATHLEKRESLENIEETKLSRFEKNLKFLKANKFLDPETGTSISSSGEVFSPCNRNTGKVISSESVSNLANNNIPNSFKFHNNVNITKPVSKHLSTNRFFNTNNLNLIVTKLAQMDGKNFSSTFANNGDQEIKESEELSPPRGKSASNNNLKGLFKSFCHDRNSKVKSSKGFLWLRDSLATINNKLLPNLNAKELNLFSSEVSRELNKAKKEIGMYKTTMEGLSSELEHLKNYNIECEKIIKVYQENQNKILDVEIENFSHVLKVYKCLYEEELKSKRSLIDELAIIVDEIYLNSKSNNHVTKQEEYNLPTFRSNTSGNVFSNYINTLSNRGMIKRPVINDFLEYKKERLLSEVRSVKDELANNSSVIKIAEAFVKDGGTATKKLDYILFQVDNNFDDLKVEYGSGLNGVCPSKSPLFRNLKLGLVGDTHSDVESPCETD